MFKSFDVVILEQLKQFFFLSVIKINVPLCFLETFIYILKICSQIESHKNKIFLFFILTAGTAKVFFSRLLNFFMFRSQ